MIKNFNDFLNESFKNTPYLEFELGLIKAWGHVLYLGYHDLQITIKNMVPLEETKKVFTEYFREADDDEDLQDWMSNTPPTINSIAVFDKSRINKIFEDIANKTKLKEPLIIYHYSKKHLAGWNSYTTKEEPSYGNDSIKRTYELPIGFPVIFTFGYADNNEVIVNLNSTQLKEFEI